MPRMTGVELLTEVAKRWPDTVRMVLTAYTDVEPIVAAINHGSVYRFLLKPWDPNELRQAVEDALNLKAARDALMLVVASLQERHEQLSAALDDLQRTQDQLMAAERLSTLGRLTSGITHDIKNQLSAMMYLVDTVQVQTDDPDVIGAAQTAFRTLQSLSDLLKDVHTFARSKSLELVPLKVTTELFLEETINLFRLEDVGRDRYLHIDVAPEASCLEIDGAQLRQALLALLRNAAEASAPDTNIDIRVSVGPAGEPVLEVRDRGCGMTRHVLEEASKPFFSAFQNDGLGLGLGIANLIAEAHGGSISLNSTPGAGTRASLLLGRACLSQQEVAA